MKPLIRAIITNRSGFLRHPRHRTVPLPDGEHVESFGGSRSICKQLGEKANLLWLKLGDLVIEARIARYLGNLYLKQGNYEKARQFFEEHLRIDTDLKFWDGIGPAYGELGNLDCYQGDYDQAEQFYKKYLQVHYEHGLEPDIQYFHCLVLTALHQNNYPLASQCILDCYRRARKLEEKISAY